MHTQLIVVFISGFLALLGIRILISSFDDDNDNDNDGDGMSSLTLNSYEVSNLVSSWDTTTSSEIFHLWDRGFFELCFFKYLILDNSFKLEFHFVHSFP